MWKIELSNNSRRFLNKLHPSEKEKIALFFDDLKNWPIFKNKWDIKKLNGFTNTYRNRIGNYRIIFLVEKKVVLIFIEDVSLRKDAYKK